MTYSFAAQAECHYDSVGNCSASPKYKYNNPFICLFLTEVSYIGNCLYNKNANKKYFVLYKSKRRPTLIIYFKSTHKSH